MNPIFMQEAVRLSFQYMNMGQGGPFGCVIVYDNQIIGKGWNNVLLTGDPTSHAEMNAIRKACMHLKKRQLSGCDIYTTCEPCPMCMGAIYWARPRQVYFANSRADAAEAGFDDAFIYEELNRDIRERKLPITRIYQPEAIEPLRVWKTRGLQY